MLDVLWVLLRLASALVHYGRLFLWASWCKPRRGLTVLKSFCQPLICQKRLGKSDRCRQSAGGEKVESRGKQQSPSSFTVLIAINLSTLCRLVMNIWTTQNGDVFKFPPQVSFFLSTTWVGPVFVYLTSFARLLFMRLPGLFII